MEIVFTPKGFWCIDWRPEQFPPAETCVGGSGPSGHLGLKEDEVDEEGVA